jgi:hypothetical protein
MKQNINLFQADLHPERAVQRKPHLMLTMSLTIVALLVLYLCTAGFSTVEPNPTYEHVTRSALNDVLS